VADVALLADDFTRLPYAIRLARRTRTAIRVNIAVALVLKLILGVGAAAGIVNLAVAVLVGDMGGSLLVTLNALRISRVPAPRPVGSSASRKRGNRP
jgi:Cd2+/Zn2+-exporting ATPase